jgi:PTH1 family peptidyl-tRNA hydrolase
MALFSKNQDQILIAGLGNPGKKYEKNRHNAGFMLVDVIAKNYNFPSYRKKFMGMFSEGKIDGKKVILLKPSTYMNNSGQSVKAACKFFKIAPADTIICHDELDLECAKIRIKTGGGNAGHNGLKSVQAHLGTAEFTRLRIGIGHPGDRHKVHGYVLKDFSAGEFSQIESALGRISTHIDILFNGDYNLFMTKISASE